MYRSYIKWYTVPAAAAAAVAAVTALQTLSNSARLRRLAPSRIVGDAESVVAAMRRMAGAGSSTTITSEPSVVIKLNSQNEVILVPHRTLLLAARELPALFDCYALACASELVPDRLKADVWNCLCATVEASLQAYCDADALSADTAAAAAGLAMAALLRRRYHIFRFLPSTRRQQLQLGEVHRTVVKAALRRNTTEGGVWRSFAVFARLLHRCCTPVERVVLGGLVLASVTHASRLLTAAAAPLTTPSSVAYGAAVLSGAATSLPARLLAGATLGSLSAHLFAALQDAASDELLRRVRAAIKTDTVLALARFDFVAEESWPVPHRVYSALADATNLSIADAGRIFDVVGDGLQRCRAVLQAPLACAAGWLTRQSIHLLRRQWTRACLMASYVDAYAGTSPEHGCTDAHNSRQYSHNEAPPARLGCSGAASALRPASSHYGLQIVLLAAAERAVSTQGTPMWAMLAVHTRWPLTPLSSLLATSRALELLVHTAGEDSIISAALLAKRTAVEDLTASAACDASMELFATPAPSFSTLLGLLRSQGDAWPPRTSPPPRRSLPGRPSAGLLDASATTGEELVDQVLHGLESVPLMAALAARQLQERSAEAKATAAPLEPTREVEAAFQVTRAVEGGADFFTMPPVRPFSSGSAFQFDVEVAQLKYHECDGYAQSIAALLFVQQTHTPSLDHGASSPPCAAAAPWRVTFDHVSFRYPGTCTDVLQDVSFDIAAGGFLGIVGYSGAGKSTLLLLLTRVYAPTSGEIYINGCALSQLPPRSLRRRIGATWQGDGHTRFLEGLSVERNVAYGGLHRASEATVSEALTAACVLDVVAGRPHGKGEVLQCCEWSGGELERLSVARALMVDPHDAGAYLFDECASGLDAVTEARMFDSGLRMCKDGRHRVTQIMVSHRLSSLQSADEIIVLAHGSIAERGTWAQLLAQKSTSMFRTLYAAQMID